MIGGLSCADACLRVVVSIELSNGYFEQVVTFESECPPFSDGDLDSAVVVKDCSEIRVIINDTR